MTRREKLAQTILKPINPSIIVILGAYTVLWGLWIANPFWTVFTQAPLYAVMAHSAPIYPEVFWGTYAIISGLFTMRGAMKPSYRNLQWGSFFAFAHWLIIGMMYFMGDWMNTGGITAITFSIYSAIVWLNVKINKEHFLQE
jgi:hypothetical protein